MKKQLIKLINDKYKSNDYNSYKNVYKVLFSDHSNIILTSIYDDYSFVTCENSRPLGFRLPYVINTCESLQIMVYYWYVNK